MYDNNTIKLKKMFITNILTHVNKKTIKYTLKFRKN